MKIQVLTEREIPDSDYWPWARAMIDAINTISQQELGCDRLDTSFFQELIDNGEASFEDKLGDIHVKTIYRIIKE